MRPLVCHTPCYNSVPGKPCSESASELEDPLHTSERRGLNCHRIWSDLYLAHCISSTISTQEAWNRTTHMDPKIGSVYYYCIHVRLIILTKDSGRIGVISLADTQPKQSPGTAPSASPWVTGNSRGSWGLPKNMGLGLAKKSSFDMFASKGSEIRRRSESLPKNWCKTWCPAPSEWRCTGSKWYPLPISTWGSSHRSSRSRRFSPHKMAAHPISSPNSGSTRIHHSLVKSRFFYFLMVKPPFWQLLKIWILAGYIPILDTGTGWQSLWDPNKQHGRPMLYQLQQKS